MRRVLYDKTAAAEQLSTSERRIDELRRARKLIAVQDGREWKYPHDELERYANSLKASV
ncbi:helix-turn-helix domain-containing protein [Mycolicibacterium vaccae]|uniref:helix-turn-helix domain-containing protein n=1 Tax=Mycolicibacterium vaccae TaxID=1810 RepID=UPI003D033DD0